MPGEEDKELGARILFNGVGTNSPSVIGSIYHRTFCSIGLMEKV